MAGMIGAQVGQVVARRAPDRHSARGVSNDLVAPIEQ